MFDQLSENLQSVIQGLKNESKITEENIEGAIREVRRALIGSDVSLKAVKTFTARVKEKALGEEVIKGVSPGEQFIKIINDEITELLGSEKKDLNLVSESGAATILALGLQGAGKTTTCAKLAKFLSEKKNKKVLLVPLDLKRPAAIEQLNTLGKQIEIEVFTCEELENLNSEKTKPIDIAKKAKEYANENNFNVVILDSAGRLQVDTEMMSELLIVDRVIKPEEKLLVIDSMIGQEAANVAAAFDTQIGVTGIILTKLDGDAKGGAALSVVEEIKQPIKLAGVGEKVEDLQEFHPDRITSRLLGMGDVLTLVEKAQEEIDEESAEELQRKIMNDFNFETFLQAQGMMSKLGNMSSLFGMMGMGNMMSNLGVDMDKNSQDSLLEESEQRMTRFRYAIQSMTVKERRNPDLLNMNRKLRIARGAGMKEKDIDQLVKEFKQMKKVMDKVKPLMGMMQGGGMNMGNMFKGLMPGGGSEGGNRAQRRKKLSKGFKPKKR